MTNSNSSFIYHGIWTNWSHGQARGKTLTLSNQEAGMLTAFLALFMTVTSARLWVIIRFVAHQTRSRPNPQDGLRYQQQVILRNSASPSATAWAFLMIGFFWRSAARRALSRSLPWAVVAALYVLVFGIATVFSSRAVKMVGNEALIVSDSCGFTEPLHLFSWLGVSGLFFKRHYDMLDAALYAQTCYNLDSMRSHMRCNTYTVPRIEYYRDRNASCPFAQGVCLISDTAAYKMDTGLLDSHEVFGINAPQASRVQFRTLVVCAPLQTEGYMESGYSLDVEREKDVKSGPIIRYNYGPYQGYDPFTLYGNWTLLHYTDRERGSGYKVITLTSLIGDTNPSWRPISDLYRTDADVSLIMAAPNAVKYFAPSDDLFFAAHQPWSFNISLSENISLYLPDRPVSVMGCTQQYQLCNPRNNECLPLNGSRIIQDLEISGIGLNDHQAKTAIRIINVLKIYSFESVLETFNDALQVQNLVNNLIQLPIPSNQWMIEASMWFDIYLTALQQQILEFAAGPSKAFSGTYVDLVNHSTPELKGLCMSQKIQATDGSVSFSLFNISIIFTVGGFLILISLFLDQAVGYVQQEMLYRGQYKQMQWVLDENLQLQRLAFEKAGMGTWSGTTALVPVTRPGELLSGFDHSSGSINHRLERSLGESEHHSLKPSVTFTEVEMESMINAERGLQDGEATTSLEDL